MPHTTRPTTSHRPALRRLAAWLLILTCAWLGTGGALCHTEAARPVFASAPGPARLHAAQPAPPADACAACQWTQGMQSGAGSVSRLPSPRLAARPKPAAPAPPAVCRVARRAASRGPPAPSTAR